MAFAREKQLACSALVMHEVFIFFLHSRSFSCFILFLCFMVPISTSWIKSFKNFKFSVKVPVVSCCAAFYCWQFVECILLAIIRWSSSVLLSTIFCWRYLAVLAIIIAVAMRRCWLSCSFGAAKWLIFHGLMFSMQDFSWRFEVIQRFNKYGQGYESTTNSQELETGSNSALKIYVRYEKF